jgi:glycosyltransferase involved in cell wall biosynthesis
VSEARGGATGQASPPLRVGYLHVGRARSGVRRYGRIVASEAAERPDLEVVQADAGERDASLGELRRAAFRLRDCDVVHVQWKLADWGPRVGGIPRLVALAESLRRPLVLTLHDVLERSGLRDRWLGPGAVGLRLLGRVADRLVVHSREDLRRLRGLVPLSRVEVVPHFVEVRAGLPDRDAARQALGVEGRRVITLLGYLTKRRGHRLVMDALAGLPPDVTALFVGAPIEGRDHVGAALQAQARDLGLGDRVRFMGYVDEPTLEQVLAATDVGLCPFRDMSASGALATWISTGRPIVASDLPPIRELEALSPGSLRWFSPYEPEAFAAVLAEVLAGRPAIMDDRVVRLGDQLATPRIVDRYARIYREVAARS